MWGVFHNANLDYADLIWEELVFQITSRKNKKAKKLPYPTYVKLIINHFMFKNNDIDKRSDAHMHNELDDDVLHKLRVATKGETKFGKKIHEAILNDKIKKLVAYEVYLTRCDKEVVVPMAQPQPVEPTQETHRKSSASVVRTGGKGLMTKSDVVCEHVGATKKKKLIIRKKKVQPVENVEKVTYVDDEEPMRFATLLSVDSERQRHEKFIIE
ncbi:hypothetical protein Tco_0558671 [Tanacetum coccineum]